MAYWQTTSGADEIRCAAGNVRRFGVDGTHGVAPPQSFDERL